jgi:ppGpp synthetase/RelA/SpoT-type nucleotidyltranferase
MGKSASKLMGGKQGKIPIKKTVHRGGKTFQQTFYVSPQEAMAMQKKARQKMEAMKQKKAKKPEPAQPIKPSIPKLAKKAEKIFTEERTKELFNRWRTPLGGDPEKVLPEPPPPEQHIRIAMEAIQLHKRALPEKISSLKAVAPQGAIVKGRPKEVESAVGKVQRKPKYGTADKLQDLSGTRIVTNNSREVLDTVAKIKERYEILEEDDYISELDLAAVDRAKGLRKKLIAELGKEAGAKEFATKYPKELLLVKKDGVMSLGYRSYHMVARDKRGLVFEIQLRTGGQNTWAEWSHKLYKTGGKAEKQYLAKHKKELAAYQKVMAKYFAEKERNPKVVQPPCPSIAARSPWGCMEG